MIQPTIPTKTAHYCMSAEALVVPMREAMERIVRTMHDVGVPSIGEISERSVEPGRAAAVVTRASFRTVGADLYAEVALELSVGIPEATGAGMGDYDAHLVVDALEGDARRLFSRSLRYADAHLPMVGIMGITDLDELLRRINVRPLVAAMTRKMARHMAHAERVHAQCVTVGDSVLFL